MLERTTLATRSSICLSGVADEWEMKWVKPTVAEARHRSAISSAEPVSTSRSHAGFVRLMCATTAGASAGSSRTTTV